MLLLLQVLEFVAVTYVLSGFSRGSRGATRTHGALLEKAKKKEKTHSGETQLQSVTTRGHQCTISNVSQCNS